MKIICGVDEAGRGPLAGPVVAAAVILPEEHQISGLNDSKKLTEKNRVKLARCQVIQKYLNHPEHTAPQDLKTELYFPVEQINNN